MLERVSGRDQWEVLDLDLSPADSLGDHELVLRDGDRLTVYSIFKAKSNMVALYGWVKHPGYYERNDTTYVSHLLRQAQLPDYNVYYERADLFRRHPDWRTEVIPLDLKAILAGDSTADLKLADRDSIHVYSVEQVDNKRRVYIEGAVKKPGWYPLYDGMSVADLVFLAGSYNPSADRSEAELARIDDQGEVELVYVPLQDETARSVVLTEDDHVFIRRKPNFQEERTVDVEGHVRYPGEYVLRSSRETLYQILQRAGGFTEDAFPRGLVLRRPAIESGLKRLGVDNLLERSRELVADSLGNIETQQQFEYDLGSMSRIIINVDRILATHGREGDVVLKPGDEVYVPSIPTGISVMGAVGSNGTLGYVPKRKVKDYIRRAGGFTRQADEDETRLIRADGEVLSDDVLDERALLGDIVVVPTHIEHKRDWGKTITTALSVATGVLTSVYIVSKL
jgi:protein involved in polysaccharide export with SLBB domain